MEAWESEDDLSKHAYARSWMDLTDAEQAILKAIKQPSDIKSAKQVGEEWSDDHIVCCGAEINGVELGFWWCGAPMLGYLECCDESPKAMKRVFEQLEYFIESGKEDEIEAEIEIEAESEAQEDD